jgi:hypothetical protein
MVGRGKWLSFVTDLASIITRAPSSRISSSSIVNSMPSLQIRIAQQSTGRPHSAYAGSFVIMGSLMPTDVFPSNNRVDRESVAVVEAECGRPVLCCAMRIWRLGIEFTMEEELILDAGLGMMLARSVSSPTTLLGAVSAHVPYREADCFALRQSYGGSGKRRRARKCAKQLTGVNRVGPVSQLVRGKATSLDCPPDRRPGDTYGSCRAAERVHRHNSDRFRPP